MTSSDRGLLVLFKSAWEIADRYEQIRGLPPGTVHGRGPLDPDGDERWQRYLAGEATEREYWLDFAAQAQSNGAPLDGHPTLMRAMFQTPGIDVVRPQARALVNACVAAGRSVGILTNELMDFQGRTWVEQQDWFPLFSVLIDSSADQIVFIDDNPTYVAGGKSVGLNSILLDVHDPGAVFEDAARFLGIVL